MLKTLEIAAATLSLTLGFGMLYVFWSITP